MAPFPVQHPDLSERVFHVEEEPDLPALADGLRVARELVDEPFRGIACDDRLLERDIRLTLDVGGGDRQKPSDAC